MCVAQHLQKRFAREAHRTVLHRGPQPDVELGQEVRGHPGEELVLVPEVAVEGRAAHVRPLGDVFDAQGGEAPIEHEFHQGVTQCLARLADASVLGQRRPPFSLLRPGPCRGRLRQG